MAQLAPMMQLRARFEDKCGHPLAGGSVFAFEVGTSTPKATFADAAGTKPNTHPIKLDYRGEADIFLLTGRYRFVVYSCTGVKIYDVDNVGEWFGDVSAENVIDGDKNQHQINIEQASKNIQLSEEINEKVATERLRALAAEDVLDQAIQSESSRALLAEQSLSSSISNETSRATTAEQALQAQVNALGVGNKAYKTYADMDADKANIPANSKVTVTNDPNPSNDGDWQWDGTTFTKSSYDPVTQSKTYTDQQITNTVDYIDDLIYPIDPESNPDSPWLFTIADKDGKVLFGIDRDLVTRFLDGVQGKSLSTLATTISDNTNAHYFNIADKNGNLLAYIDELLTANFVNIKSGGIQAANIAIVQNSLVNHPVVICDKKGNILGYFGDDGHFTGLGASFNTDNIEPEPRIFTDIIHVSMQGQSLALGLGAGSIATLASEAPNALVPSAGIEDGVQSSDMQGVVGLPLSSTGLAAFNPALNPNQTAESPLYAAMIHLQNSIDERGITSQVLGSTNAHGGTAIAGLSKGTAIYDVGVAQSKAYRDYASAAGKSCLTEFVLWAQGETDISNGLSGDEYINREYKLIADYQNDINQDLAPIMLTYQTGSHTKRWPTYSPEIPYAQLKAANINPSIKLACATYVMPYNSDGIHMPPNSYRWLGAYFGKVMDWMLTTGRTDWKPVQPEAIYRNGRVVTIKFHAPVKPLVFDTTLVSDPGNYGFKVFDSSNTELTISSVSIVNEDTVKIVLSSAPTSRVTVKYALGVNNTNAGPTTGARGNLRDSDATVAKVLDLTTNQPYSLYNWCPIFSLEEGFSWVQ